MPGDRDALSADTEVHSITDAATAHSEEMRQRMIKYAIAMGIRMVCLILIFVVDGWFKILPAMGAVFLPWVAVIIANGSDKAEVHSDSLLDYAPLAELDASEAAGGPADDGPATARDEDASMTLLQGELIEEEDERADDEGDQGRAAS
jgi:predicted tellurium resistance membrane protein TerC